MIRYAIDLSAPQTHAFQVELTIDRPAAAQALSLPVWVPGSYLVREFARHLSGLRATQGGRDVSLAPRDKASWIATDATPEGGALVVRYRIHALDVSVRAAWLDASRGFFNGTSVCLRVEGREREPHRLALHGVPEGWEIATTLPPVRTGGAAAFEADGYDALVDHPVELGRFWRGGFESGGVAHEVVVAGAWPDFDGDRLVADVKRACDAVIAFWHGADGRPPFDRYLFLLNAVDEGHGGLEHRSSTALLAARRDLPRRGVAETSDGYVNLLGLFAHEYFHAWNVKRLKPREFAALDYGRENYTELLWFFEGFTSYYDDVLVLRAGLIDADRYLKLVAKTMTGVAATPGRRVQSVADASRDAWIKYYRPDENTPNATVSYYAKGSLVALALDLTLRREGRAGLDEVMRHLWRSSGGGAVDEAEILAALEAVGGRSYGREIAAWVHGLGELPLADALAGVGVAIDRAAATLPQRLGLRIAESALTGVKVTHVLAGGEGERAGLVAGDEVVAAGDWRLRRLDDALRCIGADGRATLLVARDQRLHRLAIDLGEGRSGAGEGSVQLRRVADAGAEARARFEAWTRG